MTLSPTLAGVFFVSGRFISGATHTMPLIPTAALVFLMVCACDNAIVVTRCVDQAAKKIVSATAIAADGREAAARATTAPASPRVRHATPTQ
jgi:uncharacterized membrane protein